MQKEIGTPLRRLAGVSPLASRRAADGRAVNADELRTHAQRAARAALAFRPCPRTQDRETAIAAKSHGDPQRHNRAEVLLAAGSSLREQLWEASGPGVVGLRLRGC